MLHWRLGLLLSVLVLPGCGPYGPTPTGPARPCTEADEWQISGFNGDDIVSGSGAPPVIRMVVGQSRELHAVPVGVNFTGCEAAIASVRWSLTNSAVAAFGPGVQVAWLTARSPGETEVRAVVTLTTGVSYSVALSVFLASAVQEVSTIRVFPVGPPPPGRTIVFSGTIRLEPQGSGGRFDARLPFDVPKPGTLDMVVDWQTPTNRVIAHVCPGVVPENLGCVPVIDGNRSSGMKPATGTAQVAPGVYSFWISNDGPSTETVRYEAGLVAALIEHESVRSPTARVRQGSHVEDAVLLPNTVFPGDGYEASSTSSARSGRD